MKFLVDWTPFEAKNGYIELMTKPGLGIDVDEAAVREAANKGDRWAVPPWEHRDGSLSEW